MTNPLPFTPRLPPLDYQAAYLRDHGLDEMYGLLWAQGAGKTKALIDNAALLLQEDKIDGVLVIPPNGVHRVWSTEELPKHWPTDTRIGYEAFEWNTSKATGKRYQSDFKDFLAYTSGQSPYAMGVLCMSFDGLMTDAGKQASWDFIRKRRCMLIYDESQRGKDPNSARGRRLFALSAYAPYRRIASGTPADKVFDLYAQFRYLDDNFWRRTLDIDSYAAFKAHFGNWHKITLNSGVKVDVLNDKNPYRNLDQLRAAIQTVSHRISEADLEASLPAKHYHRHKHSLSEAQTTAYEELVDECLTVLSGGEIVTADHVLTMRLRLAQIGAGFITPAAGADPVRFPQNPRADQLEIIFKSIGPDEPTICWCMFQPDYDTVKEVAARVGRRAVVYDANRPEATLDAWKAGQYDDLIANTHSGLSEGHTLIRARHNIYYTNTPRLIARKQSEKRTHRIGQTREVHYHDLLALGTLDEANLEMVRRKASYVGAALGDDATATASWLRSALRGEAPPPPQQGDLLADLDAYEDYMRGAQ